MKNDALNQLWDKQIKPDTSLANANTIISRAKRQRTGQWLTIVILILTVGILVSYLLYIRPQRWTNFTLGLTLMISSLVFRIILELGSMYQKESKLIILDYRSYKAYLNRHYKRRLIVNYIVTPLCLAAYGYGFYLLLPYFKMEFSKGFYNYLLISGISSLLIITAVIVKSILKEHRFLRAMYND